MTGNAAEALTALGLTPLEAEVYEALVRSSPSTGYRVAQTIGKPTANVYKALASLSAKGAVLVDSGRLRQCRAVPPVEFIGRRTRELAALAAAAVEQLKTPAAAADDEGVYRLRTIEEVDERFAAMLAAARDALLVDASPEQLELRRDALAAAARRKVVIAVKAYAPLAIPGVTVHVDPRSTSIRNRWQSDWLHVVADGAETLLVSIAGAKLRYAAWTRSVYLNVVYHEALASEIILAGVARQIEQRAGADALARLLQHELRLVRLDRRGFRKLHDAVAE